MTRMLLRILALGLALATMDPTYIAAEAVTHVLERAAVYRPAAEPNPEDVASLDAIMAAVYHVISGPQGAERDWDRFRSLFIPEARLISVAQTPAGEVRYRAMSAEDYIGRSGPFLVENGFFEAEIGRKTERFGNVVHLMSAYESRRNADDADPFVRGVNSFQLMYDGQRWWIVTIYWQSERPDLPIPGSLIGTIN